MAYALENARFQWEEGERRVRQADDQARSDLERAVEDVLTLFTTDFATPSPAPSPTPSPTPSSPSK